MARKDYLYLDILRNMTNAFKKANPKSGSLTTKAHKKLKGKARKQASKQRSKARQTESGGEWGKF